MSEVNFAMNITIDFQEGFKNDEIAVYSNGKKVFETEPISTRMQIGLAKSVEFDLPGEKANIKIDIPARNISETKEIELKENLRIGVSIENERLRWKISTEPFMYA
jgi:hypothetical protein